MKVVVKKSELKEIVQLLSGLDYGLMIEPIKYNYVMATFRAEEDMDVVREIVLDYKHGLISKLIGEDIYIRDDISDAYFTFYEDDTYHVAGILVATIESALVYKARDSYAEDEYEVRFESLQVSITDIYNKKKDRYMKYSNEYILSLEDFIKNSMIWTQ